MEPDLITRNLERALTHPGCPICRLRNEAEVRYLRSLSGEHVNDPTTRGRFIDSLGYCPEHSWQAGFLEAERSGVPLGNATIYQHLADVVQTRLAHYQSKLTPEPQPLWRRGLRFLLPTRSALPKPDELQPHTRCRVCEIGEQSERTNLVWLLEGLSKPGSSLCQRYAHADGLCLPHLRQALEIAESAHSAGVAFLVESATRRLSRLQHNLAEFQRKNVWENQYEHVREGERNSWLSALVFFAGTPTSVIQRLLDADGSAEV